jgi:hypothetical protein
MANLFVKNWQAFLSGASFCIACLSLYFSYEAQSVDREYREIAIRPALVAEGDVFDYQIHNIGAGPAVVQRVSFLKDGTAVDSINTPLFFLEAMRAHDFYREKLSKLLAEKGLTDFTHVSLRMNIPNVGEVIEAGQTKAVTKIVNVERFLEDLKVRKDKKDKKDGDQLSREFSNVFYQIASRTLQELEYCSLSRRYCASIGGRTLKW